MPYIKTDRRADLNNDIWALSAKISGDPVNRPGEINYAVSQLIRAVYGERLRYSEYNEVVGVIECIKTEFYRRRAAPYEDKKIIENADIYVDKP